MSVVTIVEGWPAAGRPFTTAWAVPIGPDRVALRSSSRLHHAPS